MTYPHTHSARASELQEHMHLLATIEPTDEPFLSLYLNLADGVSEAKRFAERRAASAREAMSGKARYHFDLAMARVRQWLNEAPADLRAVALFARAGDAGQFFLVVPLAGVVSHALVSAQAPDMGPLVSISHAQERHLLVLVRRQWIQISEIDADTQSVLIWSALMGTSKSLNAVGSEGVRPNTTPAGLGGALQQVERLLRTRKKVPVILAGEADLTEPLLAALPRPLRARVADVLRTGEHRAYAEVVTASREAFSRYRDAWADDRVARLLRGVRSSRCAVTGVGASLQALRRQTVEALVLDVDVLCPGFARHAGAEERQDHGKMSPVGLAHVGQPSLAEETSRELLRLAIRQGVTVEIVRADPALRYLGGVGCLLNRRDPVQTVQPPKRRAQLRLVA